MSQQRNQNESSNWVFEELVEGVHFNDKRLDRRFGKIAESFSKRPAKPINHASEDYAAAKAAYRFFDNDKVSPEKILSHHIENTLKRVEAQERVIVVQDTSVLDFTRHHKTRGLGVTSKRKEGVELQGLFFHTSLALTLEGMPLGLLEHQIWAREEDNVGFSRREFLGSYRHTNVPLEEKESFRWIKALRNTSDSVHEAQVVMVADREADIFELFIEAEKRGVDLVIRQQHDRTLLDEERGEVIRLSERLKEIKATAEIKIQVPSNGKRSQRKARLEVKHTHVWITSDGRGVKTRKNQDREDLDLYAVEIREIRAAKSVKEPLHWVLFTTFVVETDEDALEVLRLYKMRWHVEEYFKCLKTGCGAEDVRLMEAEKIIKYVSLLSVIAWRILWMTMINRTDPDASCEAVLTKHEWAALWLRQHRREIKLGHLTLDPPLEPPTVHEAMRWLAMQGGFLARAGDGEPGLITIWRGWLELMPSVEMYELLLPHLKKQNPHLNRDVGNR